MPASGSLCAGSVRHIAWRALAPEKFFSKIKNQKIEKPKNRNRRNEKIEEPKIPESLEKRKRLQELRNGEARIVLPV
jgi:hypothetical protein